MINTATLSCTGTEQSISDCTIIAQRRRNAFFHEFAAIKCIGTNFNILEKCNDCGGVKQHWLDEIHQIEIHTEKVKRINNA